MTSKDFQNIYQFKIVLKNIKPPIWRRVQVSGNYSFWDLHVAISDAIGWQDYHLHEFRMKKPGTDAKYDIGMPDPDPHPAFGREALPDYKSYIKDWFTLENKSANYMYDFGDGWEHTVTLEKILSKQVSLIYPICVAGKRAGPPEDCGGPWGYQELIEIMANPRHPEYKDRREWLQGKFAPEDFDPAAVEFDDPEARYMIATINNPG